ncbi:MAG: hypothetical protein ABSH56_13210 [Bryobacteraceae bacterium]|jgi:CheY-like chemotaxis protein
MDELSRILEDRPWPGRPKEVSPKQAFRRFEESDGDIDLLIADVTLPVSSGIRVALELRCFLPNLRIVLTSGYPADMWNEQDAAKLSELPSDSVAILQKPWVPGLMRQAVATLVSLGDLSPDSAG